MKRLLLFAAFVSLTSVGHGQLLLNDTFNRGTVGSPISLKGSSPTFSSAPETWTSDLSIYTDGSQAFVPGTSTNDPDDAATGYIGIPGITTGGNLTVGGTYTLELTFGQEHSGGAWTAAGLGTEINTADWPGGGGNYAGFWALDNGNGVAIQYQGTTIFYDGSEPGNVDVVLSLTVGATSDQMSATIHGIPRVLSISDAPLSPISQIFVGDLFNSNGGFSNLSFSESGVEAAPEPSTWAMLLGGIGTLLLMQRLRRKLSA